MNFPISVLVLFHRRSSSVWRNAQAGARFGRICHMGKLEALFQASSCCNRTPLPVAEEPPASVAHVVEEPPVPVFDVGDQSDQDDDEVLPDLSADEMPEEIFFEGRRVRHLS